MVVCPACWRCMWGSNAVALGVEVHDAIKAAVRTFGGDDVAIEALERFEFYDASREPATNFPDPATSAISRPLVKHAIVGTTRAFEIGIVIAVVVH